MPDDDYPKPHIFEHVGWSMEVHRENHSEVMRQYQILAEICPLVLKDLEIYCSHEETTYVRGDTHETANREGMRAVWLRVNGLARLPEPDLANIETILENDNATRSSTRSDTERRSDAYFARFGDTQERSDTNTGPDANTDNGPDADT